MTKLTEPWKTIRALRTPEKTINRYNRMNRIVMRLLVGTIIFCLIGCMAHEVYLRWPQ